MSEPTLQANFSANTAGFSQGVSVLQQKLNELNTAMEQSKQEVAATNAQIRAYQQELQRLEKATQTNNKATEEQKQEMNALLEKLTGLRQGLRALTEEYEQNRQEIKETKSDISSYEKELYKLNAATDNGKKATAEQSQRIDTLRGKIEISTSRIANLTAAQSELKGRINSTNAAIRQYERELIQLKSSTNNGTTATDEQKQRMQELRDKIAQTTSQLGTMRTAQQDLQSQIKNVNSELHDQNDELKDGAKNASTFGDVLKASLCSAAVQQAVSKLASSLKSAAQYCYNVGSSFESGMSQVSAISGATAAEMEQLTQKAKDLGAATKFTASEAAEAMNYMAMAGWDAEQMLDGIDGVISLAAASGEDLGQVSDIVTDAITAFKLAAEDVNHFSDVLAAASAASNTNVGMMGETFKYCSTLAGAMGFAIEDVAEAIGVMANSGIKSTMAGTALRTLLTKLSDEVKITGAAIGEVTVKTSNAHGSMYIMKSKLLKKQKKYDIIKEG